MTSQGMGMKFPLKSTGGENFRAFTQLTQFKSSKNAFIFLKLIGYTSLLVNISH